VGKTVTMKQHEESF